MARRPIQTFSLSMSTTEYIQSSVASTVGDESHETNRITPINSGWMNKRGKINQNWKRRYFELFHDGQLIYYADYTDERPQNQRGIADLTIIIGFYAVNKKSFEVITPQRTWCFECKFKSECDHWIETMKSIKHSHVHHDGERPNDRDHLNLSSNRNVLKLMAKMGPAEGERILYSDLIVVVNKHREESIVLMLTTMALYHFNSIQNNELKKCQRRTAWRSVACCTVLSPQEVSIADVVYRTETKNLRVILQTLCEVDNEVIFRRDEDEVSFRGDVLCNDDHILEPLHSASVAYRSGSDVHYMKDITDTQITDRSDHESAFVRPSYPLDWMDATDIGMVSSLEPVPDPHESPFGHFDSTQHSFVRSAGSIHDKFKPLETDKISMKHFSILSVIGKGSFGKLLLVKMVKKFGWNFETAHREMVEAAVSMMKYPNVISDIICAFLEGLEMDCGKVFAMKTLKKRKIIQLGQETNIKVEREVLKSIDHPFLMKLRYSFQTQSKLYMVLDYYRGGDLNHHLHQRRRGFSEQEAKFIAAQIALAIGCLHSHGIVYRDLKPDNILMDDVGNCCLCDFGLCKKLTEAGSDGITDSDDNDSREKPFISKRNRLKSTQTPCGTPDYVAPEVMKRLPYDKNVDWWSFGILVFELTVGSVPFLSFSYAERFQKITSAPVSFPSWVNGGECQHFIRSLLQRTVKRRLGYKHDIDDIKEHSWFEGLDWNRILQKKVDPPYHPNVDLSNEMETVAQNVAARYQRMDARDSIAKTPDLDGVFDSFTYNGCSEQSARHRLLDGGSISVNETAKKGKSNLYPITHILNNLSSFDARLDAEIMGQLQVLQDGNESDGDDEGDDEADLEQ